MADNGVRIVYCDPDVGEIDGWVDPTITIDATANEVMQAVGRRIGVCENEVDGMFRYVTHVSEPLSVIAARQGKRRKVLFWFCGDQYGNQDCWVMLQEE